MKESSTVIGFSLKDIFSDILTTTDSKTAEAAQDLFGPEDKILFNRAQIPSILTIPLSRIIFILNIFEPNN